MISGPVLEDGEHFVFVSGVTASAMTVDPAFLTGPPAVAAAREEVRDRDRRGPAQRHLPTQPRSDGRGDAAGRGIRRGADRRGQHPTGIPARCGRTRTPLRRRFCLRRHYGFTPDALPHDGHGCATDASSGRHSSTCLAGDRSREDRARKRKTHALDLAADAADPHRGNGSVRCPPGGRGGRASTSAWTDRRRPHRARWRMGAGAFGSTACGLPLGH